MQVFGLSIGLGLVVVGLSMTVNALVAIYGVTWRSITHIMAFLVVSVLIIFGNGFLGGVCYAYHSGFYSRELLGKRLRFGWYGTLRALFCLH
jgi:hypothetical protein